MRPPSLYLRSLVGRFQRGTLTLSQFAEAVIAGRDEQWQQLENVQLGQQVERAAAELPTGYTLLLEVERHAGSVRLLDHNGDDVHLGGDHEGMASRVGEAIDIATNHEADSV